MNDISKIAQLLKVAELAIAHQAAQYEAEAAKRAYHDAWRHFETNCDGDYFVMPDERITRAQAEKWDLAIAATKNEYAEYVEAKKVARNLKRRLENAVRNAK